MRLVILLAGPILASLYACSPSKPAPPPDPPGVVQDKINDPFLNVRTQFLDIDCTVNYVLQPSGDYTITGVKRRDVSTDDCMADLIACAQTMNFSGKADPSTWTSAIKALTDNGFWDVKSISQGFHVFGPLEPDEDKKIAALPPESRPGPVASGSIEIDWRREDGKRKYLYDLIGAQMPKLYADLEAVLHLRETACTASKPQ